MDEENRESIIIANADKYLVAERNVREGNFLTFSESPVIPAYSEVELLQEYIVEVDFRLAMLELGF